MNPLYHVAIIMDGNGRWGLKYKNSRNAGHKAGLNTDLASMNPEEFAQSQEIRAKAKKTVASQMKNYINWEVLFMKF